VDILQVETGILTQMLALPYGFEIYSLLTRFNPLNRDRPYALPYRGVDVLVVGQGPAGYTLAHCLLNKGFGMAPTGAPTEIPQNEKVILCGGGLGNAVLFSVAAAMRQQNNQIVYFAAYRKAEDLFRRSAIESCAAQVIWCTEFGAPITAERPQDRQFTGNIVQAMQAYAAGTLGAVEVPFGEVDRILAIGSDRMMAAVTRSRRSHFAGQFKPSHQAIASINSPMQCMMKEICAQCMQRHIDPETGAESYVFSCFNQDQPADHLDWEHLAARLRQNSAQEKVGSLWLEHLLELGEYGEQAEESADQASTA
jgi:hypothetical protein